MRVRPVSTRLRLAARRTACALIAFAQLLLGCAGAAPPPANAPVLQLAPAPSGSLANVLVPLAGLFPGAGYWTRERVIDVETDPPAAALELFYVRSNLQMHYERAVAPVRLVLPPRIEATSSDSLTIRALLEGHRQREVTLRVRGREERVTIDLHPLANSLAAVTHTFLAARGSLAFWTREAPTFRIQKSARGFQLALLETANTPEATEMFAGGRSTLVDSIEVLQLGDDLVFTIALSERGRSHELRSRQTEDPVRGLHGLVLDLVPGDRGAADLERVRNALERISEQDVSGCSLEYDRALRESLDPAALARAVAPTGSSTEPLLRAAMKRLGEVSPGGKIRLQSGQEYRVTKTLERLAAGSQASEAIGYLALLRSFVGELEPTPFHRATLRGLLAPELPAAGFDASVERAEAAERDCCYARGPRSQTLGCLRWTGRGLAARRSRAEAGRAAPKGLARGCAREVQRR